MLKNSIKDLENKNTKMINKSYKSFEIIKKKHNQEIEKLEKELQKNEEYFNDYEGNRIEKQKEINKLNKLIKELNKEKKEIKKNSMIKTHYLMNI